VRGVVGREQKRLLDDLVVAERRVEAAQLALDLADVAAVDVLLERRDDAAADVEERELRVCTAARAASARC
jgi:hypothetical protein